MDTINKLKKNPTEWSLGVSIEVLYKVITNASDMYYNTENSILDDDEFDKLVDIYNMRSPIKYSNIGASINDKNKCKLPYHMGSMNKTKSLSELLKWIQKQNNNSNISNFIVTPKIDGTSALIILEIVSGSIKISIYTRGDGDVGKRLDFLNDILIPLHIRQNIMNYMKTKSITKMVFRGEMIVSKVNFESFKSVFKCPRSMVNGLTNKKNKIDKVALNNLEFALFEIIEPKISPEDQFVMAKDLDLNFVDSTKVMFEKLYIDLKDKDDSNVLESIPGKLLSEYRNSYKYDIDGIIISSNKEYDLPTEGNPDYSLAFKINQKGELTKIKEVEWNVSKHGVLKPTLVFDTIKLCSSNVERCSGFNGAYIFNNCLGPGAIIRVVLSGEIIPFVTEIISPAQIPSMPICGYKWNGTKIDCVILEDNDNLRKKRIITFIKIVEIDYLGEGIVNHLFNNGYRSLKSILQITKEDLIKLDRIDEKMATKLINSIHSKISEPIKVDKVMDGSLCFGNGFGIKRCIQIVNNFPDFLTITPNFESLIKLSGWSDKSINKFNEGLEKFKVFLEDNSYLKLEYTKKSAVQTSNKYKKVCITGKRDKDVLKYLSDNDIEIVNTITKNLDLLICEDKNSTTKKITTAKNLDIEIIELDAFKTSYITE